MLNIHPSCDRVQQTQNKPASCNVRSDTPASLPGNVPYKKVDQSRGTNTSRRWCRPQQKMDRTDLACLASRWGNPVLPRLEATGLRIPCMESSPKSDSRDYQTADSGIPLSARVWKSA